MHKGQMEWVGHDSLCLWHHFVVAIAREMKLTATTVLSWGGGLGGELREGVLPAGPCCPRPQTPYPLRYQPVHEHCLPECTFIAQLRFT